MAVITNTNSQRMCMLSRSASNAPRRIINYYTWSIRSGRVVVYLSDSLTCTSPQFLFFSSFILSINVYPVSMVVSPKGSIEYCFLYASYRLCDSSVRPVL